MPAQRKAAPSAVSWVSEPFPNRVNKHLVYAALNGAKRLNTDCSLMHVVLHRLAPFHAVSAGSSEADN
jgi:hypothetical protein